MVGDRSLAAPRAVEAATHDEATHRRDIEAITSVSKTVLTTENGLWGRLNDDGVETARLQERLQASADEPSDV